VLLVTARELRVEAPAVKVLDNVVAPFTPRVPLSVVLLVTVRELSVEAPLTSRVPARLVLPATPRVPLTSNKYQG